MRKNILFGLLVFIVLVNGCVWQEEQAATVVKEKQPPTELPRGILVDKVPENADIIFDSIRHVLNDADCLDKNYNVKKDFINDAECNRKIYNPESGGLGSPRQLFTMDVETGDVVQITNTDSFFTSGQVVDSKTIMVNAACSDTDNDGHLTDKDEKELYFLNLETGEMDCLTCGFNLSAINNPDYSPVNGKVVFSAQKDAVFHNYLFTINARKDLVQITDDEEYMDFDCSWSEDAGKIVFNRLPRQDFPWSIPAQVWLMDSDGSNQEKITNGGPNPNNEEPQGPYPIGIDADPDLSPDNGKIAFSRLKTAKRNVPFGVYELIVIDVDTKQEEVLDSQYANMIPQWKDEGILFIRQVGSDTAKDKSEVAPMSVRQSLYVYKDGMFQELEEYPYNVFPVGAYGGSWIE